MPDLLGATLGPYRITREIGRGGMAVVYEAYQASLDRRVAIKMLLPYLRSDREFVRRFQREAREAARLSHPNIVTIYDVVEQAGQYYIVMQLAPGMPLDALLARAGRLPLSRAQHILAQVAAALDHAHASGVVHRDVKPANIIVGPDDHTILTDFGLAKAAERDALLTAAGAAVGTPEYMSPEQAQGAAVGPASDIYALGIVLYEMLAGQRPFVAPTTPALLHMQVYEPPPPIRSRMPDLSPKIEGVINRVLAKQPAQRYRTAAELVAALSAIPASRSGKTPATRSPTPRPRPLTPHSPAPAALPKVSAETGTAILSPSPPEKAPAKPRAGRPILFWAATAASLAVVLVLAVLLSGTRPARPTEQMLARASEQTASAVSAQKAPSQLVPSSTLVLTTSTSALPQASPTATPSRTAALPQAAATEAAVAPSVTQSLTTTPTRIVAPPTPTPTVSHTATAVPTPPPAKTVPAGAPILIAPAEDADLTGRITFTWQWNGAPLAENQGFEVRIWKESQPDHYGAAAPVRSTSLIIDISGAYGVQQGGTGDYLWTVALVQIAPYQRLGPEAAPRRLTINLGGGGGSPGGGSGPPPPPPP